MVNSVQLQQITAFYFPITVCELTLSHIHTLKFSLSYAAESCTLKEKHKQVEMRWTKHLNCVTSMLLNWLLVLVCFDDVQCLFHLPAPLPFSGLVLDRYSPKALAAL